MEDIEMEISSDKIKTYRNEHSLLGNGGFGRIHVCLYENRVCAIKLAQLFGAVEGIDETFEDMKREAEIMKKMDASDYILDLFGIVRCDCWMGIVMEYAPRKDLCYFIKRGKKKDQINLATKLRIVYETAFGLSHLHYYSYDKRIAHNDLKPSNILLDENLHVKISDFGGSNFLARTTGCQRTCLNEVSNVHTAHYTAPEFSEGNPRTKEMDVFSFAMVIYFILAHKDPFETTASADVRDKYKLGDRPQEPTKEHSEQNKDIFDLLIGIMKKCWSAEHKFRPLIKDIKDMLKPYSDQVAEDVERCVKELKSEPVVRKWENKQEISLGRLCTSFNVPNVTPDSSNGPATGRTVLKNRISVDTPLQYPMNDGDEFTMDTPNSTFECKVKEVYDKRRRNDRAFDGPSTTMKEDLSSTSRGQH